jgi:hypothetical protein
MRLSAGFNNRAPQFFDVGGDGHRFDHVDSLSRNANKFGTADLKGAKALLDELTG